MHRPRPTTFSRIGAAPIVARLLAAFWMAPALLINIDWSGGTPAAWNLAAAVSIFGAAMFVEAARQVGVLFLRLAFALGALVLVTCNLQVAFDAAAHRSDIRSDNRRAAMEEAKTQASERSRLSQGRTEAAAIASETPAATFKAHIQQAIAADARRWQATGECNPLKITAGPSREFCAALASWSAKVAAAERRDEIDGKISAIDVAAAGKEVPTSPDPFAANVGAFLAVFGVAVGNGTLRAITAQRDLLRSLALELVATFGPSAWLIIASTLFAVRLAAKPERGRPAPRGARLSGLLFTLRRLVQRKPPAGPDVDAAALTDVEVSPACVPRRNPDRERVAENLPIFIADGLEAHNGSTMMASEPWRLWCEWCRARNIEPGSRRLFGEEFGRHFRHDRNNNRPRYLNVRAKPRLRVVAQAA